MKSDIDIVVIHDDIKEHSFLMTQLRESYENVELIDEPEKGINFVLVHLNEKIIVVLDIDFGEGLNGYDVLKKIREKTFLVEVIILSAKDLPGEDMFNHIHKLFGLKAFDYIVRGKKDYDIKLLESVERAKDKINSNIASAIDQWIIVQSRDKREKPYIVNHNGRVFSLNDLKEEINLRTKVGLELEKKILMAAINLLMKGKN